MKKQGKQGDRSKSPGGKPLPKEFLSDENIDELEKSIRIHYQNY